MLIRSVPPYVAAMLQIAELFACEQPELDLLEAEIIALKRQLSIPTADTELGRWERDFGLTPAPSDTLELRRAAVLALLNTHSPASVEMLRNLVWTLVPTVISVDIEELYSEYAFTVLIWTYRAINEAMLAKIREALYYARPAHLAFTVEVALPYLAPQYAAAARSGIGMTIDFGRAV